MADIYFFLAYFGSLIFKASSSNMSSQFTDSKIVTHLCESGKQENIARCRWKLGYKVNATNVFIDPDWMTEGI